MAYPIVESVTETGFSGSSTTHNVDMPAIVNAGDLLFILFCAKTYVPVNPSGWTELFTGTLGTCNTKGFVKVAAGTEGGGTVNVTTPTGTNAAAQTYRITSWYGTLAGVEDGVPATPGGSDSPNPPSLTVSWGSKENLWLAVFGGTDDDVEASSGPTDYTDLISTVSGGGTDDGAEVGSARREYTSDTDNPGVFTLPESESWVANTISIRPVLVLIYGGMLFASASSQYLASVSSFAPPANGSVCFWMNSENLTGVHRIMGSHGQWEIRTNGLKLYNDLDQDEGALELESIADLGTGIRYHIVCTYDSLANAQIYINGVLDNSGSDNDGVPPSDTLTIGHRTGAPGDEYYDGFIEDMRIYNRVLSANEIATIYGCNGLDVIVHGLLHRWIMSEGPIDVAASGAGLIKDLAIGQLNMTPNNSPIYSGTQMKYKRVG